SKIPSVCGADSIRCSTSPCHFRIARSNSLVQAPGAKPPGSRTTCAKPTSSRLLLSSRRRTPARPAVNRWPSINPFVRPPTCTAPETLPSVGTGPHPWGEKSESRKERGARWRQVLDALRRRSGGSGERIAGGVREGRNCVAVTGAGPGESCAGGALSPRRPGADPRPHRAAARGGGAVRPAVGAHVVDTMTGRIGVVMGHEGPYVQLRPYGGGREW